MPRTALFSRHQPGGVFTIFDLDRHPGDIYFVCSVTGTDGAGYGNSPDAPLATIDYAVGLCTASKGDAIYVLPGHAETIVQASSLGGLVCDVAGISIIGLGAGSNRPTITFTTATTADIDIDAANVTIKNLRFICGMAALAAPIDVNAANFTMEDCDFYSDVAGSHVLIVVLTDANANRMIIRRCNFYLEYSIEVTPIIITTARTVAIRLVGADYAVIEDNHVEGNFTVAAIDSLTTACRGVKIQRNSIRNVQTANVAGIIDLVAGTTGVVAFNNGFHGYTTDLATTIDPASCAMIQNYFSNVVTEAGGLVGTAST